MIDSFEIDLEGMEEKDLEGRSYVPPGRYHVEVLDVIEPQDSRTPCLEFKMGILAGTNKDATGMTHKERLYLSEKARTRVALFARRLGLVDSSDFGKRKSVNWADAVGRHAVVEIIEEEYEKKDGTKGKSAKVSYAGLFDPSDSRVADVPKDSEALKRPPKRKTADDFSDL